MSRRIRWFLAVSLALSLSACGWVEKQKKIAARNALEAKVIEAAKTGDVGKLRELLAGDASLANAIQRTGRRRGISAEVGTALTAAVESGRPEAVEFLLAAGADPNGSGRHIKKTPLHFVASLPPEVDANVKIAEMLLRHGARLDAIDYWDSTPIGAALNHSQRSEPYLALLRLYLGQPGALRIVDGIGRTALHFVAEFPASRFAEPLLDAGADPNAGIVVSRSFRQKPEDVGRTPLHLGALASMTSHRPFAGVLRLCAAGADPSRRDAAGKTPADLAREELESARRKPGADQEELRILEATVRGLGPGGPCETWRARFASSGRPSSWDEVRAAEYEFNCTSGHAYSCVQLGDLVLEGDGAARDAARALALFETACKGGNREGCDRARRMKSARQ